MPSLIKDPTCRCLAISRGVGVRGVVWGCGVNFRGAVHGLQGAGHEMVSLIL